MTVPLKPDSPAFVAAAANMDQANDGQATPVTPVKVPAFGDMSDEDKVAHVADPEMHHPGTTADTNRHFFTHLVGVVPPPGHVHAKAAKPQ